MAHKLRALAFGVTLIFIAPSFAGVLVYEYQSATATDLGTFGGDEAEALDVNDSGHAVGWARMSLGVPHAFIHRNGAMQDIIGSVGLLPGSARGINNAGEVVGSYVDPSEAEPPWTTNGTVPFYWVDGQPLKLLHVSQEGDEFGAFAQAINNQGRITGTWLWFKFDPECYYPGVQWLNANAAMQVLFCQDQTFTALRTNDINESGLIVGTEPNYWQEAFTWQNGVRSAVPGLLPAEKYCDYYAEGVNDHGVVVGRAQECDYPNDSVGYLWNGSSANSVSLGLLPGGKHGGAAEVNNQTMVAGYSESFVLGGGLFSITRERAFLWHANFGMKALPLPAGFNLATTNCRANALSNRNRSGLLRVVGFCTLNGKKRAIRWDVQVKLTEWNTPPVDP